MGRYPVMNIQLRGKHSCQPASPLWILIPPRRTRNLLLILITPREWIGRNIRQIGLSYIFYLHIPVTGSQAHLLSLYFFICCRGSWGCRAPLGLGPDSSLRAGCSQQSAAQPSRRRGKGYVLPPHLNQPVVCCLLCRGPVLSPTLC